MQKKQTVLLALIILLAATLMGIASGGNFLQGALVRIQNPLRTGESLKTMDNSCVQTSFRAAFAVVYLDDAQLTESNIHKMNEFKSQLPAAFSTATDGLASLQVDRELYYVKIGGGEEAIPISAKLIANLSADSSDKINPLDQNITITKKYYETHGDDYDFLIFGPVFGPTGSNYNITVKQNTLGIGRDEAKDLSPLYGTKKLKGIILLNNLNGIMYPSDGNFMNTILHEIGHNWCCYVGNNFTGTDGSEKLEIIQDNIHFYTGLASPHISRTPMGAQKWIDNSNGTYSVDFSPNYTGIIYKYHPIMLYLMGLLPTSEYETKFKVFDAGPDDQYNQFEVFNTDSATFEREVSVRDIISVEGDRKCRQPEITLNTAEIYKAVQVDAYQLRP